MNPRISHQKASPETFDAISKAAAHLAQAFPDHKLKALVEVRVSQINGCAFCLDMHSNQARALGETQQRLDCLIAWREVPFYSEKERAALAWAEAITLVSETHAPDKRLRRGQCAFQRKGTRGSHGRDRDDESVEPHLHFLPRPAAGEAGEVSLAPDQPPFFACAWLSGESLASGTVKVLPLAS
jgi:AhpD family alkylhydroperoxidase